MMFESTASKPEWMAHFHGSQVRFHRLPSRLRKQGNRSGYGAIHARNTLYELSRSLYPFDRNGRRGWTRTSDHRLRRPVLYPPELRARKTSLQSLAYAGARRSYVVL